MVYVLTSSMKTHHICPKCGGHRIFLVPDVVQGTVRDPATGLPMERFEAYVCDQCRYTEVYASQPVVVDGDRVKLIGATNSDVYEDWPPEKEPETGDYDDGDWPLEEFDVTEVSRVEKKPELPFGTKIVLVHLGPRPGAVITVLRESLDYAVESEDALRGSLPAVVMDLITADAAKALQRILEDAGAVVELQSKKDE